MRGVRGLAHFLPPTPSLKISENPENCATSRAIKKGRPCIAVSEVLCPAFFFFWWESEQPSGAHTRPFPVLLLRTCATSSQVGWMLPTVAPRERAIPIVIRFFLERERPSDGETASLAVSLKVPAL